MNRFYYLGKEIFNRMCIKLIRKWMNKTKPQNEPINIQEPPTGTPEPSTGTPEPPTSTLEPATDTPGPQMETENKPITYMKGKVMVCLDNGHGDETPGKRSPWSACKVPPELPFREYAYCREIVSRLAPKLNALGIATYIVVPEEWDVTLAERGRRINKVVKDMNTEGVHTISISIHNNAAGNGREWKKAYGWSVWTTPGQNNSDVLAQCLFDAAKDVLTPLGQKTRHDVSDGDDDYEANFAMCRMPNCPAVLTENMFQDCIDEVKFLLSEEGKETIVDLHVQGILKFIEKMDW